MKVSGKTFKVIVFFIALLATVSGGAAYAADTIDHTKHYDLAFFVTWGEDVSNITWWYDQEGEENFTEMIITAAEAWNDTPTAINMTQVETKGESILRIYSNDYGDNGWHAEYSPTPDAHISLNEYYFLTESEWEIIIAHEMGHAHGLKHYDDCPYELMYYAPVHRGNCRPFTGDIAGINDKYD